ncbi:hypothetical protein BDV30DRAFT_228388 [Aspergillus minisclerotigenes]|uniref:Uncharacterized protein n=1 Tax=Aspergillus minisclerotigenes TaxID=656917 RepID=A0A5N6IYZ8_9EURO|nr:hypothetical protein BDV30DRAFT_228388 [Aspergillus minisclerotigenes]
MPAPANTHPNPQAGVRNAPRKNDRRRQNKKAKPDHVEHATGGQPNARLRRLLRIRQRGREKRRQKKREEAQQALRPVPPPEWPSLDSTTPLSFSDVPLPGPYIPTYPLADSLSKTYDLDREIPLETSEATDHIKYPKVETADQGPKIEGGESDVSDYWDSYEKYYPDIPSPSDGERDNGVIQGEQEIKDKQRAYEVSKIKEVQNAYKSLKAALEKHNARPRISIADTHFRLYSTDYFDHCYKPEHYPSKYVKFYHWTDDHTKMNGHVILDSCFGFYFETFSSPIYASPHGVNLTENDTKHDGDIKFLSNDYLILVLSREGVFAPKDPPPGAPQYFTFFGVRFDKDKERMKRESRLMKSQLVEKKPSLSPDSIFPVVSAETAFNVKLQAMRPIGMRRYLSFYPFVL